MDVYVQEDAKDKFQRNPELSCFIILGFNMLPKIKDVHRIKIDTDPSTARNLQIKDER